LNTTHINRIGKMLEKSDKLPCCDYDGSEDYEVNPSSWTFDNLVAKPPFFDTPTRCEDFVFTTVNSTSRDKDGNKYPDPWECLTDYSRCKEARLSAKQSKAVNAFQILHESVLGNLGPIRPSNDDMEQYAACFDDFYFDGQIMPRCSIQWAEMAKGHHAMTTLSHMCYDHQQCHTVSIEINRTSDFSEEDDQSFSPGRLGHLLILLLHEMCHAWIGIFSDNSKISIEEALEQRGFRGHGRAWEKLMYKCFKEGLHHFNLPAFELIDGHCPRDTDDGHIPLNVEKDDGTIWEMENLVYFIEEKATSSEEIHTEISQALKISKEAATYYDALLESHYEPLEAVWLLFQGPKAAFFWNNRGRKLPLPSNYVAIANGLVDTKD